VLSAYLPVLLMGFLAAGSWWLVKNTPTPESPTEAVPPRHVPDYRMNDFELQRFDKAGTLRFRIEGRELRHYPDTDTVEIDAVRLRGLGSDGALTEATALRALSNADGSELQLLGEVRVRRFEPGPGGALAARPQLEIEGEFVHAFLSRELLRSHLPMRVRSAGGGELQAQSVEYSHLNGQLRLGGHTSARFLNPPQRR
jgi:lipopolysaccharide export system protein LptC